MSDGPHKSLPMRPSWRELAKRGDQNTYDDDAVAEAAAGALAIDVKNEVKWSLIDLLKGIFTGRDNSLSMPDLAIQELEDAKLVAGGSVFGMNAIAWSIELINEGKFGLSAFYEAIGLAAKARGFAGVRQVEEHYLRESSAARATKVSQRLDRAISSFTDGALGALLADPESKKREKKKKNDVDEGVPF